MIEAPDAWTSVSDRPLNGLRVVDLVVGTMALVGRYLADLGAEVLRVEPPGGAADRRQGIRVADASLEFSVGNARKRSVILDLTTSTGREAFDQLLVNADVLIENSFSRAPDASTRIDGRLFSTRFPLLVVLSISDFGQSGSHRGWVATDPVFHALSGELSRSGIPDRAPLLPPDGLAIRCAAAQAAYTTLLACVERQQSGRGDWLDFSMLDGVTQTLDPGFGIAGSAAATGQTGELPRGRVEARHQYPIIACADGHVRICVLSPRQWQGMFEWMGRPEAFADPAFEKMMTRFASPDLVPAIGRFFSDKTGAALEEQGQRHGVPTARLLSADDAIRTPQIQARQVLSPLAVTPRDCALVPDGLIAIDGVPTVGERLMPALDGEPSRGFQSTPRWCAQSPSFSTPLRDPTLTGRPLAGLKVLDLGVIVVGAETGRLLADAGADVIKIESTAFPDGSRQTRDGSLMSPSFAAGHRNKRSLVINLRDPRGKAVFLQLARSADVLLANFKPGTLESLGLDPATLADANPRLVCINSSAYGSTGPWSGRMGYGPLVRAAMGVTSVWSYPGDPGSYSDAVTVYPDHVASRLGALAALALLIRRHRTDAGGVASIAQAEVILDHLAAQIAARELAGNGVPIEGRQQDVPWGVFRCAGDDEWCVVTVRDDRDWRALAVVIGLDGDPSLNNRAARLAQAERIDAALLDWLAQRSPTEAMRTLQAIGVPAASMLRVIELPQFSYYRERGFFREARHPVILRPFPVEARPVRATTLQDPPDRPAPMMGEHSVEVLRHWLDMPTSRIQSLLDDGVVVQRSSPPTDTNAAHQHPSTNTQETRS